MHKGTDRVRESFGDFESASNLSKTSSPVSSMKTQGQLVYTSFRRTLYTYPNCKKKNTTTLSLRYLGQPFPTR